MTNIVGRHQPIWKRVLEGICSFFSTCKRYLTHQSQYDVNKLYGLSGRWVPPLFYGPARDPGVFSITPKGMKVYTRGFDRKDIPRHHPEKKVLHIRVSLGLIDDLWRDVRDILSSETLQGYPTLTSLQKADIARLPDNLPVVKFAPTIWYDKVRGKYMKSQIWHGRYIKVALYYKSVSMPELECSWEEMLTWEFKNAAFYAVGRHDLVV